MHVFNQVCAGHRPVQALCLVIAFLLEVCVCGCVCVFVCAHGCVFAYVFMCVYVCASVCVCLYLCLCLYVCLCLCVLFCLCMYTCVCIYVLAPKVKITNGMIQIPYNQFDYSHSTSYSNCSWYVSMYGLRNKFDKETNTIRVRQHQEFIIYIQSMSNAHMPCAITMCKVMKNYY